MRKTVAATIPKTVILAACARACGRRLSSASDLRVAQHPTKSTNVPVRAQFRPGLGAERESIRSRMQEDCGVMCSFFLATPAQ